MSGPALPGPGGAKPGPARLARPGLAGGPVTLCPRARRGLASSARGPAGRATAVKGMDLVRPGLDRARPGGATLSNRATRVNRAIGQLVLIGQSGNSG